MLVRVEVNSWELNMEISIYFLSPLIFANKVYYYRKLHVLKVYRKIISQIRNNELKPVSKMYTVEFFCSSYFPFVKVKFQINLYSN
jgi:hypothetical protein